MGIYVLVFCLQTRRFSLFFLRRADAHSQESDRFRGIIRVGMDAGGVCLVFAIAIGFLALWKP